MDEKNPLIAEEPNLTSPDVVDISPDPILLKKWEELIRQSSLNGLVPVGAGVSPVATVFQSTNFKEGTSGWRLSSNGNFEANDATFRGTLESNNYVSGETGWRLEPDGDAEFNGTLTARRISLDSFIPYTDSSVTYTGTWANHSNALYPAGGAKVSTTINDTFEIAFTGTSIGLWTEKGDFGKIEVYIDNVLQTTVDLYNANGTNVRHVFYSTTGLTNAAHVIKGKIVAKNASASSEGLRFQGYTLYPGDGIKMAELSTDMLLMSFNVSTDGNGYVASTPGVLTGYSEYCIVGVSLTTSVMSDATATDPKLAVFASTFYLYNGAASTSYDVRVTFLASKQ
jgi:hypothetical protein